MIHLTHLYEIRHSPRNRWLFTSNMAFLITVFGRAQEIPGHLPSVLRTRRVIIMRIPLGKSASTRSLNPIQ